MYRPKSFTPISTVTKGLSNSGSGYVPKSFTPEKKTLGGFAQNVMKSGGRFLSDIGNAVIHPLQTGKSLVGLGAGVAEKFIPGRQAQEKYADEVGKFYKQRYGGFKNIGNTLYNDPVGVLGDVSVVAGGVGAGLKGAAGAASTGAKAVELSSPVAKLGRLSSKVSRFGEVIDPLQVVGRSGRKAISGVSEPFKSVTNKLIPKSDNFVTEGLGNPSAQRKMIVPAKEIIPKYNLWARTEESAQKAIDKLGKERTKRVKAGGAYGNLQDLIKPLDDEIQALKSNPRLFRGDIPLSPAADQKLSQLIQNRNNLVMSFAKTESKPIGKIGMADDLATEARKYKSAEELLKIGDEAKSIDDVSFITPNGKFVGGGGLFSHDKLPASIGKTKDQVLNEGNIRAVFSTVKGQDVTNILGQTIKGGSGKVLFIEIRNTATPEQISAISKKFGNYPITVDITDNAGNVVKSLRDIKASQLTDIYNQTHKPQTIHSTNLNPKVSVADIDAYVRENIKPNINFDKTLDKQTPKTQAFQKTRKSLSGAVDEAAGTKQLGKEMQSLYKLKEKVFPGYQSRVGNRQRINVHKLGSAFAGGLVGGIPGAIAGFALEQFVNSPKGAEIMYKTLKSFENKPFGKVLTKSQSILKLEKALIKAGVPKASEVAKYMYNYAKAGRMVR